MDPYAAALGVLPNPPARWSGKPPPARGGADPAPGSGIVDPTYEDAIDQTPENKQALATTLSGLKPPRSPQEAAAQADLRSEGARLLGPNPAMVAAAPDPYAAALGVSTAKFAAPDAPVAGPEPLSYASHGFAAIPREDGAAPLPASAPAAPEHWYDKPWAAMQAGANTVAGAVGGTAGLAYGALEGAGQNATRAIAGLPPIDVEQQAMLRARQFTPELPKALQTPLGQQYTEDVGNALATNGPSIIGIGPEIGMLGKAMGDAKKVDTSFDAMKSAFEAKKATARVEPTMAAGAAPSNPGIEIRSMNFDRTEPSVAPSAWPSAAPTLADAPQPLRDAVATATAKGTVNPDIVARHVEAQTLPVPVPLTEGQASLHPATISEEMNGRGKGAAAPVSPDFYKAQGQAIGANIDAIRAAAAPDVPATASIVDHGQSLLDAYKQMDEPIKADISAKYKALADANGGALPLNGQDFAAAADAALSKQMKGRYVPPAVAGDLESFRNGGPMTFEDFENLRTNLAAEARKADRAGDGNAAGAVNIVRNALESLPMTNETAAIKPLADAARQAAAARFAAIKADPAYKAAISDSVAAGEPSPLADKFFRSYVTNGARANVAKMTEALGNDPIAKQTIAAGTLDQLKAQLKADPTTGNFSQDGYNKGLKAISPKLDTLLDPKTAQQAQALGNVAKYAQTQPRGSFVNNSNTATALVAEGAKAMATHGTNMLFGGLPVGSVARAVGSRVMDTVGARKASQKATAPGAGVTRISDFPKP